MKNTIKIILLIVVLLFSFIGCSVSNENNTTTEDTSVTSNDDITSNDDVSNNDNILTGEIRYGETFDGAGIYGPCIKCAGKFYVLDWGTRELPADSEFLGKSSEAKTRVVDGDRLADVSIIDQNRFPDTMYTMTMEPYSTFYISSDGKTIYREKNEYYDVYIME